MKTHVGQDPRAAESRSLAGLVRQLAEDAARLIRQEIALARAELSQNVSELAGHAGRIAMGGAIALLGLLVLVSFAVIGLGVLLGGNYWLSSLIVAVATLAAGAGLAYSGARRLGDSSIAPGESIDSVRQTGRWLGQEAQELRAALADNGRRPGTGTEIRIEPRLRSAERLALPGPGARRPGGTRGAPKRPITEPLHKRVFHEFQDDDVTGQGAKVAFFMFTSLPPALLVLFALTGIFGGEQFAAFVTQQMSAALPGSPQDPESAAGFLSQFVDQIVRERAPGALSIGVLTGLWAASAVFVALADSLNIAFDVPENRSWWKMRVIALATMAAFLILFLSGSVILLAGPQIAAALDLGGVANAAWSILQWPAAFLLVVAAFFLIYYTLPNRSQSNRKAILFKSSAIATALWLLATIGFRVYISNFGSFSETYGVVGAILVMLLWMYMTGIVVLTGGEIASEMEREA
jgi:membrane protein